MAQYHHRVNTYHKSRRARRVRKFAAIGFLVFFLMTAGIGADWLVAKIKSRSKVTSESTVTAVQAAHISVLKTGYFQFQAPEEWVLLNNESNDGKFVYVKKNRTLYTHMLTVYVNKTDQFIRDDAKLTHVIPVDVDDAGMFTNIGSISSHCSESWPQDLQKNPAYITHEQVRFKCVPDSDQYNILIGKRGAGEDLIFSHQDNDSMTINKITINMVYSDLTASPGLGDLPSILSSFVVH